MYFSKSLVALTVLALLFSSVVGQGSDSSEVAEVDVTLTALGATFPFPIYSEFIFFYQGVRPNVEINYTPTGSGTGKKAITEAVPAPDFIGSDSLLKDSNYEDAAAIGRTLVMFPMLGGSVVPVVQLNDPDTGEEIDSSELRLDRYTLLAIFANVITRWDDPAIAALNPGFPLPAAEISVMTRADSSGTTEIFIEALNSFSEGDTVLWPYGVFSSWPETLVQSYGAQSAQLKGNFGVLAGLLTVPNSVGYLVLSFVQDAGISYVPLFNRAGALVGAESQYVEPAIANAKYSTRNTAVIVDDPDVDAWPIAGLTYIVLDVADNGDRDCTKVGATARYLEWSLVSKQARARAASAGYAVLPPSVRDVFLTGLQNMTCNGEPVVGFVFIDQHDSGVYEAFLAIACLCAVFPIVLFIVVLVNKHRSAVKGTGWVFAGLTLLGCLINFVAVVLFYLVPSNNAICALQPWFVIMGFTLLLAPMLAKVFVLWRIASSAAKFRKFSTTPIILFVPTTFLLCVQLVVCVLWTAIDMYSSAIDIVDPVLSEVKYVCKSDTIWVWIGLEIGIFSAMMLGGVFLAIMTRNSPFDKHREVKWIGFSMYNLVVFMVIMIPLLAALDVTDSVTYFLICMGLILPTFCTMCTLYVPLMVTILPCCGSVTTSENISGSGSSSANPNSSARNKSATDAPSRSDV